MNYFELFGLATKFDVPADALDKAYLKLQKESHPDKYVTADVLHRSLADRQTAQINLAYNTLKHPVTRSLHLLTLLIGKEVSTENTINDTEFLMEQMKWRELVEEAGDDIADLKVIQAQIKDELQNIFTDFSTSYANGGGSNPQDSVELTGEHIDELAGEQSLEATGEHIVEPTEEHIDNLQTLVQKMQYFTKLDKDIVSRIPAASNE